MVVGNGNGYGNRSVCKIVILSEEGWDMQISVGHLNCRGRSPCLPSAALNLFGHNLSSLVTYYYDIGM